MREQSEKPRLACRLNAILSFFILSLVQLSPHSVQTLHRYTTPTSFLSHSSPNSNVQNHSLLLSLSLSCLLTFDLSFRFSLFFSLHKWDSYSSFLSLFLFISLPSPPSNSSLLFLFFFQFFLLVIFLPLIFLYCIKKFHFLINFFHYFFLIFFCVWILRYIFLLINIFHHRSFSESLLSSLSSCFFLSTFSIFNLFPNHSSSLPSCSRFSFQSVNHPFLHQSLPTLPSSITKRLHISCLNWLINLIAKWPR